MEPAVVKPKSKINVLLIGCCVIFVVLIISIVACGAIGSTLNNSSSNSSDPQKIGQATTPIASTHSAESIPTPTPTIILSTFYLNEQIQLDSNVLTVYSVANYTAKNQFMAPKSGNKYVTIDLSIENKGNEPITSNPTDFKLQDLNSYSYDYAIFTDKEPRLSSDAIQPGRKVRGFITFEIPTDSKPSELLFTPNFWSTKQIIIKLTNKS